MKNILVIVMFLSAYLTKAQDNPEEFLPIIVEDKEAFMSTKTGEYVFRAHDKTNAEQLKTTPNGVYYNDIIVHNVKQGETLTTLSKKYDIDEAQIKKDNLLKSNTLKSGQKIKIINRVLVPSSSPVISYAGEERVIAKLRPGQSPSTIAPPPTQSTQVVVQASTTDKTTSPDAKKIIKNKSTYSKPLIVPVVDNSEDNKIEKHDSKEVAKAEKKLAKAKKKLEAAKRKEEKAKEKERLKAEKKARKEVQQVVIQEKNEAVVSESFKNELATIEKEEEKVKELVKIEKQKESSEAKKNIATNKLQEGVDYHTVVKGDNLFRLSKKYNTTVKKLTELNNVKFNNLQIGQKLKLK